MNCIATNPQITGGMARILYPRLLTFAIISYRSSSRLLDLISTESAGNLVGDNANECKHWITGIFYFEWSNSSVHLITLASNKINSRFDRLLPDYLRDTVEWITKYEDEEQWYVVGRKDEHLLEVNHPFLVTVY
uniref:Uncharacterized protein n=1 Tax=Wuchereria bancrofti TaxID=6293 RepID=A0AAF5PG86_WUCBA